MTIVRNCRFGLCASLLLVCLGTVKKLSSFFTKKQVCKIAFQHVHFKFQQNGKVVREKLKGRHFLKIANIKNHELDFNARPARSVSSVVASFVTFSTF